MFDHRPLSLLIKLSLRTQRIEQDSSRLVNFSSLSSSKELRTLYAVAVNNRFEALQQDDQTEPSLQSKYNHLIRSCCEIGKDVLPKKQKRKWKNLGKSDNVASARASLLTTKLNGSGDEISAAKETLKQQYKVSEAEYIERQVRLIENASYSSRHVLAWKVANEVSGRKDGKMMGKINGTINERKEKWLNHFQSLLGSPPTIPDNVFSLTPIVDHDLPIETSPFTASELESVINCMKRGGAVGIDSIPLEIWESTGFRSYLLELCNEGLIHHKKPFQ